VHEFLKRCLSVSTKGVKICDLPDDYRRWALNNLTDMDPYLRKALEGSV
jgi:hypothetical protein